MLPWTKFVLELKPKSICMITSLYPPYPPEMDVTLGGSDIATEKFIDEMKNNKIITYIISLHYMKKRQKEKQSNVHRIGTYNPYLIRKDFRSLTLFMFMELFRPLIFIKTLKFLRKKKPDIVIIGKTYQLSLAPILACKLLSIQYIIRYDWLCPTNPKPTPCTLRQRMHCADCIGKVNKVSVPRIVKLISVPYFMLLQNIKKLLWNNAKSILAVSEYHKSIIQSFGIKGELIKIAPNTIEVEYDEEFVKNLSDKYHLSNSYNLLYVGRLEPEKGIEFLIDGFEYMKKNHVINKNIKLLIVGTGLLKSIVSEKSKKNENIIYIGYIPHEEIGNYYALADAVIIPTVVPEGHPIVAEEAMSLEKPIIGLDIGGLHDIFNKYQKSIKIDSVNVIKLSNAIVDAYQKWGGG